ncbi:MAG: glycosyl hydrolase 53 family protein [Muribaculaceae bacterium]|nr:glycosyl hydrolase 53 family protein [Muribaculaceae bacterium]
MNLKHLILSSLLICGLSSHAADIRFVGGDISLLPTYEEAGVQYKDLAGNRIELLPYLYELGMNAMRVRLFVDPGEFATLHPDDYDENACQDLPYIIPLCQDIIENGMDLMLDFHYSDTWADPGAQWIPNAWAGLSDEQLVQKIYEYTKESLLTLKENGITPRFIQPGNEISYGMLWAEYGNDIPGNHVYTNSSQASWTRFGDFLKSAIKACREICPEAQIIIHTERVSQVNVLTNFYDKMKSLEIDYDIIGLSYYPYFHGNISVLDKALNTLEERYPGKPIMIVETGFPVHWEIPGTNQKVDYEYSPAGQDAFAHDLVDCLLAHSNVDGLFWWWLEYNPYLGPNNYLNNWYNAPLFDPNTGQATPALKTIASYGTGHDAIETINDDLLNKNGRWYDLNGRQISHPTERGVYIYNGKKIMIH